jgi:hypothetical protein
VDIPVLVIIGKKDRQIDWQVDGDLLKQAAVGKEQVTFSFPERANHVLKEETRPRSQETATEL